MQSPMHLEDLETPVAVIDVSRMRANLRRVADYCAEHGIGWRPHVKTHKNASLAALQREAGALGLTAATQREAEVMADIAGDLLVAYPPVGRAERLMALPEGVRLTVGLDSAPALNELAREAQRAGRQTGVVVEIDVGMGRVGVPTCEQLVDLARLADETGSVAFRGIMFYPGHIRGPVERQDAEIERVNERLREAFAALDAAGFMPEVVSGGSTPTLWQSHRFHGLTEVRPGTNIFNDRTTAVIGACRWSECAYSVLATVVSTAVPGQAVIDAGSKALAKEELRGPGGGFGALLDQPEIAVRAVSEEHGILNLGDVEWRPAVGDRVRVVPNHVCVSVNLQETLFGVEEDRIVERWPVMARGRSAQPAA